MNSYSLKNVAKIFRFVWRPESQEAAHGAAHARERNSDRIFLLESAKLLGEIARSDRDINEEEISEFKKGFIHQFAKTPDDISQLIEAFKSQELQGRSLQEKTSLFYWRYVERKADLRKILFYGIHIVIADGAKNQSEAQALETVARAMGMHLKDLVKIEDSILQAYYEKKGYVQNQHRKNDSGEHRKIDSEKARRSENALRSLSRTQHLKVLGLTSGASSAEIKTAYRRLVKENHPDKNQNSNGHGVTRFHQIQTAYESLKRSGVVR